MADLWSLVWGKPQVDPTALAEAIEQELVRDRPDVRTRILIRDSTHALEQYWGSRRWADWLARSPVRNRLEAIRGEDLGEPGFPLLKERLVARTEPETVSQFLRELGSQVPKPVRLRVGGAIALILSGFLARATGAIDVVDEVPAEIRAQRPLLDQLAQRYGLQLTHFQSHYLPSGWESRLHLFGSFGNLHVEVVDVYDIFLGKLFSRRAKDLDDLRALAPQLDRAILVWQLPHTTAGLLKDPSLRQAAERNWYILYGEALPLGSPPPSEPPGGRGPLA
jgi:hypothetical protein